MLVILVMVSVGRGNVHMCNQTTSRGIMLNQPSIGLVRRTGAVVMVVVNVAAMPQHVTNIVLASGGTVA